MGYDEYYDNLGLLHLNTLLNISLGCMIQNIASTKNPNRKQIDINLTIVQNELYGPFAQ